MICSIPSATVNGIRGQVIDVECYITNGLPSFEIVGLPDAAVKEAKERVRAAAKTSGLRFPNSRITVNLAPANIKKSGTHFDLPMLLCVLSACGVIRKPEADCLFIGELGLDGTVRRANGVLPMIVAAKNAGFKRVFVPEENAPEATLARGPIVYPVRTVAQLVGAMSGEGPGLQAQPVWVRPESAISEPDFKDVFGQHQAKRALEIAAAGSHNILMVGPPGSGKSMLSKRLPSILPDMTWNEALDVTMVYSVMGLLRPDAPMVLKRPFRSPHHTVSNAGLVGGGTNPKPGEISLAHKGVLFLDELPEFRKDTLDLMRQPLEDASVTIARVSGSVSYPAEFMMVCAMNPCKCGWYGDPSNRCTCSSMAVEAYRSRLSGPFLDRIDMIVEIPSVPYIELKERKEAEPSAAIKQRVNLARQRQNRRYGETKGMCNARMGPAELREFCQIDEEGHALLQQAFEALGLTARSYDRILRVARTIADLAGSERICVEHLSEAIQYRTVNI